MEACVTFLDFYLFNFILAFLLSIQPSSKLRVEDWCKVVMHYVSINGFIIIIYYALVQKKEMKKKNK